MPYDLISVGLNAVDVLVRLPESVLHDGKQFVDDLIIQGGAPVGSGSCGVARLGFRVGVVARLGKNTLSAISLEDFRSNGVGTGLVVRDEESRPAIALVEIDHRTAARTVFIQMDDYGYLKPGDIPAAEIAQARVLLVDGYDLDATEVALAAAVGTPCRSILDFESGDPVRLKKLLGMGTDPILPLAAARTLTGLSDPGDVLRSLGDFCPGQVVATDGIHGSWAWDRDSGTILHQPAFVVQPVDTTGCGDAYHAGYIVGVLEGWPLELRMEFGSLLASHVAGRVGGRTALPWKKDVRSMIRSDISETLKQKLSTLS
ncbi:MAG: PfkB family carbohydrate kinase [Terrimicrobiaceae bacterium]